MIFQEGPFLQVSSLESLRPWRRMRIRLESMAVGGSGALEGVDDTLVAVNLGGQMDPRG